MAISQDGGRVPVPPLLVETDEDRRVCEEARARRAERLKNKLRLKRLEGCRAHDGPSLSLDA